MEDKYYYDYNEFKEDIQVLTNKCRDYNPCVILGIARGGLTMAHLMAHAYDMRNVFTLNSIHYEGNLKLDTFNIFNIPDMTTSKKVLIVDDIIDSGETMKEILRILKEKFPKTDFKIATIFYKPTAIIEADYKVKRADKWIDFFWEVDIV